MADGSDGHPLVTVGIPTYNRAALLRRALASVEAQDHPNIQLVVSDNASTDDTPEVCRSVAERLALVYVRQAENLGVLANFRAVVELAEGEYFMWLGDDDELSPHFVSSCLAVLTADDRVLLAGGTGVHHHDGAVVLVEPNVTLDGPSGYARALRYWRVVHGNSVFYGVMRSDVARRVGLRTAVGSDALFVAALSFLGHVVTVPSATVRRDHGAPDRSSDLYAFARAEGLSAVARRFPWVGLAGAALVDIGAHGVAYSDASRGGRAALGVASAAVIMGRASWWQVRRHAGAGARRGLRAVLRGPGYDRLRARLRSARPARSVRP